MMVTVHIPTPLRAITNGRGAFQVEAATVQEALDRLDEEYAGIKNRLCEDDGTVRRFLNVYLNEEDIRFLQGLKTPVKTGDEITIVPAMAGGVSPPAEIPWNRQGATPKESRGPRTRGR